MVSGIRYTEGTFLPLFTQEEIEWFQTTNL